MVESKTKVGCNGDVNKCACAMLGDLLSYRMVNYYNIISRRTAGYDGNRDWQYHGLYRVF